MMSENEQEEFDCFTDDEMAIITPFLLENNFLKDEGNEEYSLAEEFRVFAGNYILSPINILDLSNKFAGVLSVLDLDPDLDGGYVFWFILMVAFLQSSGKFVIFEAWELQTLLESAEIFTQFLQRKGEKHEKS